MELWEVGTLLAIGVAAGLTGGLLGIGGAVVTIPAISLLIGRDIHLAQAAAMNVTFFVALPSAIRHYREGALNTSLLKVAAPMAVLAIIGGVFVSNVTPNELMKRIFGIFLIYVIFQNVRKLMGGRSGLRSFLPFDLWFFKKSTGSSREMEASSGTSIPPTSVKKTRGLMLGGLAGGGAGILGIGGGLITVPLAELLCKLRLQEAIATSAAIMCFTSIIGAITKDLTFSSIPFYDQSGTAQYLPWYEPIRYAIWLIPTCIFGSWFGAKLTHLLPLKTIRVIFICILAAGAAKMLMP
tara:strand:- start:234 stop:1121 length:888 start_codon:yes stop_codon:yes gene_type:complete